MNIKTFQAASMAEALKLVKQQLGRDAVILSTRTIRRGGLLGLGARNVVEVTASTDVNVRPRRRAAPAESQEDVARRAAGALQRAYGQRPAPATPPAPAAPQRAPMPTPLPAAPAPPQGSATNPEVEEEIRQIRRMVHRMMKTQSTQERGDLPDQLFARYLALLEQEVSEELADQVIRSVRGSLSEEQLEDADTVERAVGAEVARLFQATNTSASQTPPTDGRPLTIALVGPTGVGKTTTVAKLAATFKLRDKKRVALVTIDTYRIAAVEQLRTYANIIQLPLEVVQTPAELTEAMGRLSGYDVVLIDTAGRGQRDDGKLKELSEFIDAANPHEVHLVLASTCGQSVLMEAVERFRQVRHDRIIFTKLDEAVSFGVLLNVVRRVNKQLSYVTTGQEVPHQIEPGQADRLAGLILGGDV